MEKITYRSEIVFCGKPRCRKCQQGIGHGPYWYAYRTVGGRLRKTYIGLHLPEGVVVPKTQTIGRVNQSTLIGREHEQALLQSWLLALERAGDQREQRDKERPAVPGCTLLLGEAGIGKTRLAEEVARKAAERGWSVAWSHAYPQESTIPYRIWIEVLRKAMNQNSRLRREIARRPPIYRPLGALLPELQDLLPQDALPPAALPEQEQLHLWEAICALLSTLAGYAPLLIMLDDLQWADSSSCELLAYLVRQLRGQPVMIVGTCREIELPANHPLRPVLVDLQREQAVEMLTIQRLTDEQIRALVSHMPEPVVRYIQTSAAGNPFFAEELARGVGASRFAPSQPAVPGVATTHETAGPPGDLYLPTILPDTISAVLDLHLGRSSLACQRLLARAAVLGGSFEFSTILAMEAGGPDASEDIILDLLDEALQAGMLTEEGSGMRITYHFWHPLLVSHLYDGISAGRRASLHRRAAEVLREIYQGHEQEGAPAIVYHLVNGGAEASQIAYYAELAGDCAYALSAYPEAEYHYRLAIKQRGTLAADAGREGEWLHLTSVLERLGECTMIQGKFEEARHFYEWVLEVRGQQGVPEVENRQEAQRQAILLSEIGWTWRYAGDLAQAHSYCQRGEQQLRTAGVTTGPALASLRYLYSSLCWQEGRYDEAYAAALEALSLFEHQQEKVTPTPPLSRIQRTLEGDPVNQGRIYRLLSALSATIGKNTEALDYLKKALTIFERYDHQREIAIVSANLGDLYLRMTKYSPAEGALRRALDISERIGDLVGTSVALGNLGILASRLGNLVAAETWYRRALDLAEQIDDPDYISLWLAYLAAVLRDQEKLEEAGRMLRRAISISRAARLAPCTGFCLAVLGSFRIAQARACEYPPFTQARRQRLLGRAHSTLVRALATEGLEAETSIEAQLTLAQVTLLRRDPDGAWKLAIHALDEASTSKSGWLVAQAQGLLGNVLTAQIKYIEAEEHFSQALQLFRESDMHLEYARVLHSFGTMLLQREQNDQRGLDALQEARQLFNECHAILDLHQTESSSPA